MDDVEAYYARLGEYARRLGFQTLASFMHVAVGLHEKWKQPKKGPTLGELRKIRDFLGISWGTLLDGAPEPADQMVAVPNGSDLSVRDAIDRIEAEIREREVTVKALRRVLSQPPRPADAR